MCPLRHPGQAQSSDNSIGDARMRRLIAFDPARIVDQSSSHKAHDLIVSPRDK